jgi:uncharacterized protein YcaQ
MSNELARAFLLDRLGLRGPLWNADRAAEQALRLGMIQIDSIRVCGLRNHEIAWASRTDAPVTALYDLFYKDRVMLETHYPIFATRRDWLPWFLKDFHKTIANRERLQEIRPVMRQVMKHIAANGPASPADFESERVSGGFNTIKATTKALEYLFAEGKLQISGRTKHFHRLFDLTERVAPELATAPATWRQDRDSFFVHSALSVLKLATPEQLAGRVAHHVGTWRGGGLPMARRLVAKARDAGLVDVLKVTDGETTHDYLALKSELDAFQARYRPSDETVRLIPPLDNLMFSRRRFTEMFGFTFKFEAYTPQRQRQFYFALPIVYRDDVVGLLDAKKDEDTWQVRGLQVLKPIPAEHLRNAVLRLARIAGATKVKAGRKIPAEYRKAITGMCV